MLVRGDAIAETRLDFGIKIEEGFETRAQLLFNLFLAAFEDMHSDVGVASVCEFHSCLTDFSNVFGGQEPHAVDQG